MIGIGLRAREPLGCIVISPEIFFFCRENSSVKRGKPPTGGPRPTLPTPACWPPKQKEYTPLPPSTLALRIWGKSSSCSDKRVRASQRTATIAHRCFWLRPPSKACAMRAPTSSEHACPTSGLLCGRLLVALVESRQSVYFCLRPGGWENVCRSDVSLCTSHRCDNLSLARCG